MKTFPTFRLKSFRTYYPTKNGPGPISMEIRPQEKGKHIVVIALATVDESEALTEDWLKRAVAAAAQSMTD